MGRTSELREAYIAGAQAGVEAMMVGQAYPKIGPYFRETWEPRAAEAFPAPTTTEPNVVEGSGSWAWRLIDGHVEYRVFPGSPWKRFEDGRMALGDAGGYSPADYRALAEIHENPTITVELDD